MNIPYDLLHKWAKNSNNDKGGPKMSSHEQQKIADITKKRKYKVLYRGTVVSNKNMKSAFKIYTIPRLQSWTTNKKTAVMYATNKQNRNHKMVVFYTTTTTDKVKSYKLNNNVFSNRNIEVIVDRPVFKAFFDEKEYDPKINVYFVPIEFIESHNKQIVSNTKMKTNNIYQRISNVLFGKSFP